MAKKWTVMVYMAADKDSDLDSLAIQDLREMERVGTNDQINVVVQINRTWPGMPQRYVIRKSGGISKSELIEIKDPGIKDPETTALLMDMGQGKTLSNFLEWAAGKDFEAEHYFLVLWGHAYGLGFGRDHDDPLTLSELKRALNAFTKARGKPGWQDGEGRLELLGANACAMAYAEAACEMQGSANFMVASQIAVPLAGWPYESILKRIGNDTTPEALGRIVVEAYMDHYATSLTEKVAMTLLNLDQAGSLPGLVDKLARALFDVIRSNSRFGTSRLTYIRNVFRAIAAGDVCPIVDLVGLGEGLKLLCGDLTTLEGSEPKEAKEVKQLRKAAEALQQAACPGEEQRKLIQTQIRSRSQAGRDSLVVLHRCDPDLDGLHGLGIFAPFVTDEDDLVKLGLLSAEADAQDVRARRAKNADERTTGRKTYDRLTIFARKGPRIDNWPTLVYDELRQPLAPAVMDRINRAGAVTRADQSAVSQLLLAIDSAFGNFDRAVASAQVNVAGALKPVPATAYASAGPRLASIADFTKLQLLPPQAPPSTKKRSAKKAGKRPSKKGVALDLGRALRSLAALEAAVTAVERAARKMLTDGSFGLGLNPDGSGSKRGLGFVPTKPSQLGFVPTKPSQLGFVPTKPSQLGFVPTKPSQLGSESDGSSSLTSADLRSVLGLLASTGVDSQTAALTVADLFRQVGESLFVLELVTADVEQAVVDIVSNPTPTADRPLHVVNRHVERGFQMLQDTSAAARRTLHRVLTHPVHGFGPSPDGLDLEIRQELANLGGLNRQVLKLL